MHLTSKLSVGEIGHQHMQARLAAAISPLVSSPNTWMKWSMTTTLGTPCPTCGIPCHFRKRAEQIKLLTFCHIFKSCTQDSCTVLAVMANVIQQRKSTMPANGHRVLSTRTKLGVTTAGPALLAQASSPAKKVLRSGVLILLMHKGVSGDLQVSHAGYGHTPFWGVNLPL